MSASHKSVVITHPDCIKHVTGFGHPERHERLEVIMEMLDADLPDIDIVDAPLGTDTQILYAHPQSYIDRIATAIPAEGLVALDDDTKICRDSLVAARYAVGAACLAADMVCDGRTQTAFCAIRPPGHHAEVETPMGFCIFANAYIAARHAQIKHGIGKVAIVDFDVHHGNGTAAMIYEYKRPDIFFTSSHQFPFWPGSGDPLVDDDMGGLILDVPLPAGTGSTDFRRAYSEKILPRVKAFAPELIVISAGFDAHKDDPLAGLHLDEEDFRWVTEEIKAICPKIVSVLEGGYDLNALANSVRAHLEALKA